VVLAPNSGVMVVNLTIQSKTSLLHILVNQFRYDC